MARKEKKEGGRSAYDAALSYLTPKARTVREVELKLDEGNYSEGEIMQTIERLTDAGLLDDEKYAAAFVESRLASKPVSRFRLTEQLRGHFVPDEIIVSVLGSVPEDTELENARSIAEKFARQFSGMEDGEEKRRRIYSRLRTRGFSHETIIKAMNDPEE